MTTAQLLVVLLIWLPAGILGSGIRSYRIWLGMTGKVHPLLPHQRVVCIVMSLFGLYTLVGALIDDESNKRKVPLGLHPSTKYFFLKG